MSNTLRCAAGALVLALAGCNLDVTNPSVIDAAGFNPGADEPTLTLSAQSNFFLAYQDAALYGGMISDEVWTAAIRLETNNIASRNFVGTDDINVDFFSPFSIALASNINAATLFQKGDSAATDLNLATVQMNAGFTFEIMAETMCAATVLKGPQISDAQMLDSAITRLTAAVTIATAAGATNASPLVAQSNVGLARAYLQNGQYANAAAAAALVPAGFVDTLITTANSSTLLTLANQFILTQKEGQLVVPALYRHLDDPRVQSDSTSCNLSNGTLPCVLQLKYATYASGIRLASSLEAQFIAAEAQLHGSGNTGPAVTLINAERVPNGQGLYAGPSDTLSVLTELLNQRAREFWMEGKKLGDLRRNPSVPLTGVLTEANGAPFYGAGKATFGSTFCVPIPPEETGANPNLSGTSARPVRSSSRRHL